MRNGTVFRYNCGDILAARRTALICLALFALNAAICLPLFRIEYLNQFQSNEGSYITFAHFLQRYWPHVSWFPWFNAGMPFEDTYLPLTAAATAVLSWVARTSPAHAFHFLSALIYSLAPVLLFLFARWLSGSVPAAAGAAVLWSLVSPSALFPQILRDMGTPWGIRRLQNIVVYGETPHNFALCLLFAALLLIGRFLDRPSPRRFAAGAIASAAVMATNAFGIVVVSIASLMLFAARGKYRLKTLAGIAGILAAAYLAICRVLTPALVRLIETNSQLVGGDYRFTWKTPLYGGLFAAGLVLLWAVTRRARPDMRFAVLFTACFAGIAYLGFHNINVIPQPARYHLEMEAGVCLLAALLMERMARRLPRGALVTAMAVMAIALGWVALKDYRFARRMILPADITEWAPYREARWIAANLPGQRVLVAGEGQWLFNLFTDNPQLGAGHEPSAPNWMQRVAVYTIFSGSNAGNQDGPISVLWLETYGVAAITVPGPASKDHFHAIVHPAKLDGLLPLAWRESGESIYRVPLRSPSLAHAVPRGAIVRRRPMHGLDVDPIRPYVAAIEDPAIPQAQLRWNDPDDGVVQANVPPGDVISVQTTWDPGWRARVAGREVPVSADALGFIVIDPECTGPCSIELSFAGGMERNGALAVSLLTGLGLIAMIVLPKRAR